jgi:hypothetical protein
MANEGLQRCVIFAEKKSRPGALPFTSGFSGSALASV